MALTALGQQFLPSHATSPSIAGAQAIVVGRGWLLGHADGVGKTRLVHVIRAIWPCLTSGGGGCGRIRGKVSQVPGFAKTNLPVLGTLSICPAGGKARPDPRARRRLLNLMPCGPPAQCCPPANRRRQARTAG